MSKNRFKYRAWNKIDKKMYTGLPYSTAGKDSFVTVLKFPSVYEVSECANVCDSDKVLVYEGDYLSDGKTIWEVVYCETMSGFSAKAVVGGSSDSKWFSLYHLCNGHNAGRKVYVVGNRYEYKGAISNLLNRRIGL